jgi:hypothetical protein
MHWGFGHSGTLLDWSLPTAVIHTVDYKSPRDARRDRLRGCRAESIAAGIEADLCDRRDDNGANARAYEPEATSMPSTDVFGQNTNVLRLIARRWFGYLPGIRWPTFVKLSIRLQCRLPERRRVTVAAK